MQMEEEQSESASRMNQPENDPTASFATESTAEPPYRIPHDAEESPFEEDAELGEAAGREAVTAFHGSGVLRTHQGGRRGETPALGRLPSRLRKVLTQRAHEGACSAAGGWGFALPFSTPSIVLPALPLQRAGAKEKGSPRHHLRALSCTQSHTCPPGRLSPGGRSDRHIHRTRLP